MSNENDVNKADVEIVDGALVTSSGDHSMEYTSRSIFEDPEGDPGLETNAILAIYDTFKDMNDRQRSRVLHWVVHRYGMTIGEVFPDYDV